jgi:hypothetical protein
VLGKDLEVVLLTEKRREIRGQCVHELLPLHTVGLRFQPVQVGGEAVVTRLAQAPGQAAVDHGVLAIVQADAGPLVDQRLYACEIPRRPLELTPLGQGSVGSPVVGDGARGQCRIG